MKKEDSMKAVIKVGGKQVLASLGSTIYVEKINGNVGDTVRFNEVQTKRQSKSSYSWT